MGAGLRIRAVAVLLKAMLAPSATMRPIIDCRLRGQSDETAGVHINSADIALSWSYFAAEGERLVSGDQFGRDQSNPTCVVTRTSSIRPPEALSAITTGK